MREGLTGLLAAAALVVVGLVCVAAGMFDRDMADAQAQVVTEHYAEAAAALDRAERLLDYGRDLPWIARGPLNDVRARQAAVRYWRREYSATALDPGESVHAMSSDNVDLGLIAAHATYRLGQPRMKDRQTSLQVLDAASEAYLAVLKNTPRHERAAYNYEYLRRLRQDVDKGRRRSEVPGAEPDGPLGRPGKTLRGPNTGDFKVLVPLESPEREKAGDAGKAPPLKRRG